MYKNLENISKDYKRQEDPPGKSSTKHELHWQLRKQINHEDYGMPIVAI